MRDLLWLIPTLPFLGALANGVAMRNRIGKRAVSWIACGSVGLACALAIVTIAGYLGSAEYDARQPWEQEAYRWVLGGPFHVEAGEGEAAGVASLEVAMAFQLDPLAAVMAFVVTFVGFWIHVYSVGYMGHEEGFQRYFTYLNLFMGAMLLLVLGANYLVMFVGWEGVGLCSYLLIGFYFKEEFPPYAGRKAFIVNRIGDFAFVVGLFALLSRFGTLDFTELFGRIRENPALATGDYHLGLTFAGFVALALFIGAMGKSAQIPLYVWLPDAMAGPTPVSALIHAATMVTAGVYMVARSNVIYQLAPGVSLFVAGIGCATAILAATIALAQDDIKKVLAYSTVSQLGYMFLAAGVGAYTAAIFHLYTHAFFKALLFLGSGSVIHAMGGEQDMRRMGGLRKRLPQTYRTFWIATVAIAGIPPLAGFFSKDEILHGAAAGGHWVLYAIALLTAGLTAFYMFRAVHLTFGGTFRGSEEQRHHLHESPPVMTVPLWALAVGAVAAGWVGIPAVLSFGADVNFLHHFLAPVVEVLPGAGHGEHALAPGTEWLLVVVAVAVAASGILLAARAFGRGRGLAADEALAGRYPGLRRLLANKWYVDELYDWLLVRPLAWLARMLWKVVDTLVIEGAIHVGAFVTELAGDLGRFSTTGNVRNYALYFFLGLVALFWWMVL
jgi:NADH-quinone oxidoreductase subunit L